RRPARPRPRGASGRVRVPAQRARAAQVARRPRDGVAGRERRGARARRSAARGQGPLEGTRRPLRPRHAVRKALLFLLLFASGLLLLYWLERPRREPSVVSPADHPDTTRTEPSTPQGQFGIFLHGPFAYVMYDEHTGRELLRLASEDS